MKEPLKYRMLTALRRLICKITGHEYDCCDKWARCSRCKYVKSDDDRMTREEAIYRLKNTAWLGTNKDREETEQAVDIAIEALTYQSLSKPNNTREVDLIRREDAIEVVEVVRCKDCKFGVYEKGRGIYHIRCEILEFLFQDDDYCSYGERREE